MTDRLDKNIYPPILAIDFDGTITRDNDFPNCGVLMPGAKEVIKELHEKGCIIILYTCRVEKELEEAIEYLNINNIPIDYVNRNIPEIEGYYAYEKVFANYYIDDLNIGGFPGWEFVRKTVLKNSFFNEKE